MLDAHTEIEHDHSWQESNPDRWTRVILDWKDHYLEDGTFRIPDQWKVNAHDC
ncbi:hypothetical protein [Corynebacterium sp. HMSC036E10]|uniref:hypothetical protein n=1 Tax=Corynebacterium sp. HMSC036E10 TaxID=1715215 RepID=UPI0014394947|nr:hypothetical protein [Corynebacterium sp. HMSC036E10]